MSIQQPRQGYRPATLLDTHPAGSEYETTKVISTKIQSAFGISANIHKGINSIEAAITPGFMIISRFTYRLPDHDTMIMQLNMMPLKKAYRIHECVQII